MGIYIDDKDILLKPVIRDTMSRSKNKVVLLLMFFATIYQIQAQPDDCISCVAGTYSDVLGLSSCRQCGEGKFSTILASESPNDCANCGAGKYSSTFAANTNTFCLNCGAGKYSTAPVLTLGCQACGQGKFSTTVGAHALSFCMDCQKGKYSGAPVLSTDSCQKMRCRQI